VIASLSLANFKCFKSLTLDLGSINVLAGVNGAGKSTVIQSLLVLRQSLQSGAISQGRIQLRGGLTDLGTAGEVYCADPNGDFIGITISQPGRARIEFRCPQTDANSEEYYLRIAESVTPLGTLDIFPEPFNYLDAERIGPRKAFEIPGAEIHQLCVGKYGENAPFIVASMSREIPVDNDHLILESSDGKEYPTIQFQWVLWMARLFPGFDAESDVFRHADQVRLGMALQTQATGRRLFVRPTNTGFGLSFVLGIVVAGLAAKPNTALIVENPEAHLHPKAQSDIGEFLGRVAAGGAQVFVETHSEHIMNGIRRMLKQAVLAPEDVRFFFFSKPSGAIEPMVVPITVTASGDLSSWPDGFFDQLDKDLNEILN